jgi:excisionase family DNA binding protein
MRRSTLRFMDAHTDKPPRIAYSLDEAARSISISRRTLYKLMAAGSLPTTKLGARRVVTREALERLFAGQGQPG